MLHPAVVLLAILAQTFADQICVQLPCQVRQATADIVLVYDKSNATTCGAVENLRDLMKSWAHKYNIGSGTNQVQFATISYERGGSAYTSYRDGSPTEDELDATFDNDITCATSPRPQRNIGTAFEKVANNDDGIDGYRPDAYHAMLVVSSGKWTDDYATWKPMLDRTKCFYPNVFGIVYGPIEFAENFDQLQNITDTGGNGDGNVFLAASYTGIEYALSWILGKVSCTTSPTPPTGCTKR